MLFYQHISNAEQRDPMTLEEVFGWNIRFQVFVRNQEEYDLLSAYQLMFGREIQIDIFDDWMKASGPKEIEIQGNKFMTAGTSILPITFTTWKGANLQGL